MAIQAQANAAQLQQQASLYAQQASMGLSARGGKVCSVDSPHLISVVFLHTFLAGDGQGECRNDIIHV